MSRSGAHLPFSVVVGQDDAKLALMLAAVEPRLGGVLLRGDKGSAKTTLARGLAALLPAGAPFVELPLGAGEDRVVGAIDVAALLGSQAHTFRTGLLAAAHGGVLYVDEINLLPDHLVDTLLDVAVSGVNRVERDGLSETHPARFVLVGSMNPEEGELRPQLLDRFGLAVEVRASDDPEVRAEIVRRQLAFDASFDGAEPAEAADGDLRSALGSAVPVPCGEETIRAAARLAVAVGAQGLRADLALCRAASALAGLEGRAVVEPDDLRRVAPMVLGHRRRRQPFEAPGIGSDDLSEALDQAISDPAREDPAPDDTAPDGTAPDGTAPDGTAPDSPPDGLDRVPGAGEPSGASETFGAGEPPVGEPPVAGGPAPAGEPPDLSGPQGALDLKAPRPVVQTRAAAGPRAAARQGSPTMPGRAGRVIGHQAYNDASHRLDPTATVVSRIARTAGQDGPFAGEDVRAVVATESRATLVILAVDASGSMGGRRRLEAARTAVLALLGDAYRRRDRLAVVAFRGDSAEVVLRPTGSVEIARTRLTDLPSGGRTPLAAGLIEVTKLVRTAQQNGGPQPTVVLVTDGRATSGGPDPLGAAHDAAAKLAATGVPCLVIDAESGPARLGLAKSLADILGAEHAALGDGGGKVLAQAIRDRLAGEGG